jgi:hypothetical protein
MAESVREAFMNGKSYSEWVGPFMRGFCIHEWVLHSCVENPILNGTAPFMNAEIYTE